MVYLDENGEEIEIDKETDEDNGVVYLDENGEEIDKRTLMMMMKNNKIV